MNTPTVEELVLTVIRAHHVKWKKTHLHSDVPNLYVAVEVGDNNEEKKTHTLQEQLNPEWNQKLKLLHPIHKLSLSGLQLHIKLRHKSRWTRSLEVGRLSIGIEDLLNKCDGRVVNLELEHDSQVTAILDVLLAIEEINIMEEANEHVKNAAVDTLKLHHDHSSVFHIDQAATSAQVLRETGYPIEYVFDKCIYFVEIFDEASKIHPWAQSAWNIISSLYKVVQKQRTIDNQVINLSMELSDVINYAEAAWAKEEKIKRLEDTLILLFQSIVDCCMFIREYSHPGFISRLIGLDKNARVASLTESIAKLRTVLKGDITLDISFSISHVTQLVKNQAHESLVAITQVSEMIEEQALSNLSEFIKGAGAAHDSDLRFPPPRCDPETRQEIQTELLEWISCKDLEKPVCWVHGPAGVGKSAIAQTIAELSESHEVLGASFFFSRNHGERSRPAYLVPTIAYQLASSIPELNDTIGRVVRKKPAVLHSSVDIQFKELFVNTCRLAILLHGEGWMRQPRVIIIDGLDECMGTSLQQGIISLIASTLKENFPFRFLIFSRPEPHIREAFEIDSLEPHLKQLGLDDSWETRRDIKKVLETGFISIRNHSRNAALNFPDIWPSRGVVDKLVEKACGQFVYAHTVLKFVDEEHSHPVKQLAIILGLRAAATDKSPFKDLDVLYDQILSSYPDHYKVVAILGALIRLNGLRCWKSGYGPCIEVIELLLGLDTGEVSIVFRGMHSVLDIHKTHIQILHASFRDYLLQKSRSGPFYIGDSTYITRLFLSFHTARVTIIHPGQLFVLVKDFDVSQFRDYIPWRLILVSDFSNILFLYFFAFAPFLTILLFGFALLSTILNWDVALRFSLCFFATANLAKLLGEATERVSVKFGETHAGIFKMSFRNMSEVILGVSALLQGQNEIAQQLMLGFILCNVLLVLGGSFLAAGLKFPQSNFGVTSTQVSSSLIIMTCITSSIPVFRFSVKTPSSINDLEKWQNLLIVSRVTAIMLLGVYLCYLYFQLKSHAYLFETELEEQEEAQTSVATTNLIVIGLSFAIIAFCLIASIEGLVELYNIPKHFIGLFLIPLANASKYGTPVWMAVLGQMDTTISFCIGNSIQLAAFVVPLLVILGWILGQELTLFFNKFETIIFFVSIYLAHTLIMDGQSNCLEGLILITLYLIIGLALWVL